MEERLKIIDSFKSLFGKREKGIEKRIQFLKFSIPATSVLAILTVGIVICSIIFDRTDINMLTWSKMGLFVLLSISGILRFPNGIYEFKLLNHLERITKNKEYTVDQSLDLRLREIIEKLNTMKHKWILMGITGVIGISSIWQFLGDGENPFLGYTKILVLIFYGMMIFNFIKSYKKLDANIKSAEVNS